MINTCRVQLVAGWENIRPILCEKCKIPGYRSAKPKIPAYRLGLWVFCQKNEGHGRTGQVKKAGFFGRSVTLLKVKLNRGSAIDFINALVEKINKKYMVNFPLKPLSKGGFFRGGSSDAEIAARLDSVCRLAERNPDLMKTTTPASVSYRC